MKSNWLKKGWPIAVGRQVLLVPIVFWPTVSQFDGTLFQDHYDGLKNYFTYQSFIQQEGGLVLYKGMNYPYGEYLFYTDNTPLIAFTLNLFNDYVVDISGVSIWLFNLLILLNFPLATYFAFKLLYARSGRLLLSVVFSVLLIWVLPQVNRLPLGHMNLSLSWLFFAGLYLLYGLFVKRENAKKYLLSLGLLIFGATFLHIYYLPILVLLVGGFSGFWLVISRFKQWKTAIAAIVTSGLAFVAAFSTIRMVDDYYAGRKAQAEGYDWDPWKLQFDALFTPYNFQTARDLLDGFASFPYEAHNYLGTGFILALLATVVVLVVNRLTLKTTPKDSPIGSTDKHFGYALLGAAFLLLMVSMGSYVKMFNNQLKFDNVFSVFYWGEMVIERIKQFRCLARFGWPAIVAFQLLLIAYLITRSSKAQWYYVPLLLGLIGYSLDAYNQANNLQDFQRENILASAYADENIQAIAPDIEAEAYQAILVLPFFHVGSENYRYTIDDQIYQAKLAFQLQGYFNLPLINSKMSRTSIPQTQSLFRLVMGDTSMNNEAYAILKTNGKPILVCLLKFAYDEKGELVSTWPTPSLEPAKSVVQYGKALIEDRNLPLVAETETIALYQWQLP